MNYKQKIYAKLKPASAPQQLEDRAVKQFGITDYAPTAGFILTDGRMLNFGVGGGVRTDHREITFVFEEQDYKYYKIDRSGSATPAMLKFMELTGAIRMHMSRDFFNINYLTKPTYKQVETIRQIIKDYHPNEITINNQNYDSWEGSQAIEELRA
jgi:hypothetical protein